MFSAIVEGETAWSEFLLLLAVILCLVVGFIRRASVDAVLMAVAVACIAGALLVL